MVKYILFSVFILIGTTAFSQNGDSIQNLDNKVFDIDESYCDVKEVFPNPFSNDLNITFLVSGEFNVLVRLFDIVGKEVFAEEIYLSQSNDKIKLNLENLPLEKGIYLLRIEKEFSAETIRLIRE